MLNNSLMSSLADSLLSLRKKLNVVENEKLDAISAANQEVWCWKVKQWSWLI